ncbi:MAG: hypothetical protein K2Q18_09395, partial [Bdellovibrionales bacterium]|nr:hypothetical protein [Bdellovibrionales bacterium]
MKFKVFIVLLGLIRFFGDTFQISALDKIGFASGFSPLPLVFSDRKGVEDFAHVIDVTYQLKNGQTKEKIFNQEVFLNLKGPQTKSSIYAIGLAYSTRFPEALWGNTLRYGFCNVGPMAQAFNEKEEIQERKSILRKLVLHKEYNRE